MGEAKNGSDRESEQNNYILLFGVGKMEQLEQF